MLDPSTWRTIHWPDEQLPMVVVVVDTEAEFDWARHRPRQAMGVTSVKSQMQVQRIFERYQVRPTYVLDYPVSSTPEAYEIIRELHHSGTCEIGAHLQPWDNPPFFERKTDENSYPGNLPFELEREKLLRLSRIIQENVGVWPRIYKAAVMESVVRQRRSLPNSVTRSILAWSPELILPASSGPISRIAAPIPIGLVKPRRCSRYHSPSAIRGCLRIPEA